MKKELYLLLSGIGLAAPYTFFLKYLSAHGFEADAILQNLFANQISAFFAMDLVVATVVFWFFVFHESRRLDLKFWGLYVLASAAIGLSFALPLYLYFRERKLDSMIFNDHSAI